MISLAVSFPICSHFWNLVSHLLSPYESRGRAHLAPVDVLAQVDRLQSPCECRPSGADLYKQQQGVQPPPLQPFQALREAQDQLREAVEEGCHPCPAATEYASAALHVGTAATIHACFISSSFLAMLRGHSQHRKRATGICAPFCCYLTCLTPLNTPLDDGTFEIAQRDLLVSCYDPTHHH